MAANHLARPDRKRAAFHHTEQVMAQAIRLRPAQPSYDEGLVISELFDIEIRLGSAGRLSRVPP